VETRTMASRITPSPRKLTSHLRRALELDSAGANRQTFPPEILNITKKMKKKLRNR